MFLSYLPCFKKFGLPPFVCCPANRNVNDEECLPLISVSKGCTSLFRSKKMTFPSTKYWEKSSSHFPFTVIKNEHSSGYRARRSALLGLLWDWLARCQYTVTGWDGKLYLPFLPQCGSTQFSQQRRPWYTLACSWGVKQASNQPTNKRIDWSNKWGEEMNIVITSF